MFNGMQQMSHDHGMLFTVFADTYTVVVGEVWKSLWTIRDKKISVEFFIRMFIVSSVEITLQELKCVSSSSHVGCVAFS